MTLTVTFTVPPEVVEQIAKRAAELLAERQAQPVDRWIRDGGGVRP